MLLVHGFPHGCNPGDSGLQAQPLYDAMCDYSAPAAQVHPSSPGRQALTLSRKTD